MAATSIPYTDPSINQSNIENVVMVGAAVGGSAYGQTYELESDVIGTYIARTAGYDPIKGARYFARPENPMNRDGQLSFWGTHPPDEKRIATVIATIEKMDTQ